MHFEHPQRIFFFLDILTKCQPYSPAIVHLAKPSSHKKDANIAFLAISTHILP